jgi:hypothetical protein
VLQKAPEVITFDLPLDRLAVIGQRGGICAFRRDKLALAWTHLPAFDSYVLNLFAPIGTALWNFNVYASLLDAEISYAGRLMEGARRSANIKALEKIIRAAGHPKKSDFASLLLGIWTATPEFSPPWEDSDVHFRAHRHRSVLVPEGARESVNLHFSQQVKAFGLTCVKRCPDSIALSDDAGLKGTSNWRLLADAIPLIASQAELDALLARIPDSSDETGWKNLESELDIHFGIQGRISLWVPPARLISHLNKQGCAALLRFRLRVALRICSLPQIELFLRDVETSSLEPDATLFDLVGDEIQQNLSAGLVPYRELIAFRFDKEQGPEPR